MTVNRSFAGLRLVILQLFLLLHKHLDKLLPAYDAVTILVDIFENLFDAIDRIFGVVQKRGYLLIRNGAGMVQIEIVKGLLELFLGKVVVDLQPRNDKLSQIDVT